MNENLKKFGFIFLLMIIIFGVSFIFTKNLGLSAIVSLILTVILK